MKHLLCAHARKLIVPCPAIEAQRERLDGARSVSKKRASLEVADDRKELIATASTHLMRSNSQRTILSGESNIGCVIAGDNGPSHCSPLIRSREQ